MRTSLLILCSFLCLGTIYGQKERVKGNKIVSTEEYNVEGFHTIEIYEGFEVTIDESSDSTVKIEADSNMKPQLPSPASAFVGWPRNHRGNLTTSNHFAPPLSFLYLAPHLQHINRLQ